MKVTDVRCVEYVGQVPGEEPIFRDRLRRPTDCYPEYRAHGPATFPRREGGHELRSIFLHIDTDEGLVGSTAQLSYEQAVVVLRMLRPHLLGADPLARERIWDVLYRSSIHGRRGLGMTALSAVDCALWDLAGQFFGVPAHVVLGGPMLEQVPCYASTLGDSLDPADVGARTRELVLDGFGAVKWFPRWGPEDGAAGLERIVELVAAAREAGGPGLRIRLDAWSGWDVPWTVRVVDATAHLDVDWIEEPLPADQTGGYQRLREQVAGRVRLAGGEHEYTRWGYRDLMATAPLDVYQPDPHWAGGISEVWKVMALVGASGQQLVPHGQSLQCNAALTFAAPPHFVPEVEYIVRLMPLYQHFLAEPLVPQAGVLRAPTATGLGMALDEEKILDALQIGVP